MFREVSKTSFDATNQVGEKIVETTIKVSDKVSDASTITAGVGVIVTIAGASTGVLPLAIAGAKITTASLAVSQAADITSTVAKTIDAMYYNGSKEAAVNQALVTATNWGAGKYVNSATRKVIIRTSLKTTLFRSKTTGRFIRNKVGFTYEAARDATSVLIGIGL